MLKKILFTSLIPVLMSGCLVLAFVDEAKCPDLHKHKKCKCEDKKTEKKCETKCKPESKRPEEKTVKPDLKKAESQPAKK